MSAAIPKCLWPGFLSCVQCEGCIIKVKEISGTTHEPGALTGDFLIPLRVLANVSVVAQGPGNKWV